MDSIAGSKSSLGWAVNISVVLLVALWVFPTFGLLVSSFRTADQISGSGWWASLFPSEQTERFRAADPDENRIERGGLFVVEGNIFAENGGGGDIQSWGTSSRAVDAYQPGEVADLGRQRGADQRARSTCVCYRCFTAGVHDRELREHHDQRQ